MERSTPQESDLRLARARGRALRAQHGLADEDDRLRDLWPGRVGSGGHDSLRGVQAACRRTGSNPERFADDGRPRLQGGGAGSDRRRLEARRCGRGQVALRRREQWLHLSRQALGARPDGDPRAFRGRGGQGGSHRRPRRRSAEGESRALCRLLRREHRQGPSGVVQGRLEASRPVLDPADPDHSPGRLRRARGGRHPAPAGTDVGARHAWRGRPDQPGVADVRLRLGDHPLDRARGRGRLHDVLLEARA